MGHISFNLDKKQEAVFKKGITKIQKNRVLVLIAKFYIYEIFWRTIFGLNGGMSWCDLMLNYFMKFPGERFLAEIIT